MYRGLEECLGKGNNLVCLGYRKLGSWGQKTRFQVQLIAHQLIQSWNWRIGVWSMFVYRRLKCRDLKLRQLM